MPLEIAPLRDIDFEAWRSLAIAYEAFYANRRDDAAYARMWTRLHAHVGIFALGAYTDGRLAGFTHYLFHASCWRADVCYLQDLFVAPADRGRGLGRALIQRVVDVARARGAARVYWHTQSENRTARRLYDAVAVYSGFIRYEVALATKPEDSPGAGARPGHEDG